MDDKFDVRDTPRQLPTYPGKNRCMPQGSKVPKNQILRFRRVVIYVGYSLGRDFKY